jgi:hypothetical protein
MATNFFTNSCPALFRKVGLQADEFLQQRESLAPDFLASRFVLCAIKRDSLRRDHYLDITDNPSPILPFEGHRLHPLLAPLRDASWVT